MSQESCQDRQNNELEVLRSIFGDELRVVNQSKNNKKWQPLNIYITLTPQKGMSGPAEVYAQVDLHVICGDKYPTKVPRIQLENSKGLSDQKISSHLLELEKLARELEGEEMIYELCQHTQKFLHEHNKPTFSSFYDEMVTKQQEKIQNELLEKQLREDQERQVLQDEILKRKEALKAEIRNRRDSLMDNNVATQSLPSPPIERIRNLSRRRNTSTSESSESLCEHRGTKTLNFDNKQTERKVYRGKCLGHSTKGSIVHAGVDNTTGELLAVTEWTLKCGSSGNYDNGEATNLQNIMKQIASIEQELNHLNKLRHHNLVHYLNMKYFQDKDKIKIYILQEFVVGTTCSFYLSDNIPVDTVMLRHLATGVLTALSYLHENNVVHKDLRDSSVHIDRSGMVKVADYSLEKRLSDIHGSSCLAKAEHDFPTTQGRGGKKADIYRFGILMLSLLKGEIVSNKDLSKEVDLSIKPDLRDFLNKCLVNNERTRWTAEQLLEHCFIKTAPDRGFHPSKLHPNLEGKNLVEPERDQPEAEVNFHLPSLGGSRIQNEFEVLKWLGKGAFGDVLKVKNKLDGCIYAIKRIKLNPKNKQLNKKITREVKLLSRLNHENVVRYYNSWIESANLNDSPRSSRLTPSESLPSSVPLTGTDDKTTSSTDDYLESVADVNLAPPPMHEVGWNISYESRTSAARSRNSQEDDGDQSSDDSDTDEEWPFVNPRTHIDSSDSIQFERDDKSPTSESAQNFPELVVEKNGNENEKEEASIREIQFMYIQMEFCEKSTLRTAIDNGLYEDEDRIWRLFREIIEGLAHIHQQAMIHRDLKPVNIFLDSNDHVKIGDFGLATTNILSNLTHPLEFEKETQIIHEKGISSEIDYGGSLTGQVGTALYVAPELSTKVEKAIYNQKVDIYSLGIIFFEMCHKPLSTGMERVKVLLNLRSKDIILPPELDETFDSGKTRLLRWLLNHDPSQRPTSQELLASELLPPPELEETELQDMARRTLSNVQSKAYKYLIGCCLSQDNTTTAADLTYEMNLMGRNILTSKSRFFREFVKSKIVEVFQRHGGISITTPLLMPKSGSLYSSIDSHVRLMTRTGSVVSIPHDLHASFARYVALNSISNVRRYAIERVYRETKVHGFHPRELYECAFDIISPTVNNLMPEAELLYMTSEIFNQIPKLQDRGFVVRINHTSLLQAVLMYSGIESEKYQDIYSIIRDAREENLSKLQVRTRLISLCLTDQAMDILFNLFDTESTVQKISGILKTITKRKGDAAGFAKKGLTEIEIVIEQAQALGVKWPITIVPLLVNNTQLYSGIIYQVTCEIKRRRRHGAQDVIAAGGRYDSLLRSFRQMFERTGMNAEQKKQCGVGISISLDKVVSVANELSEEFFHDNRFTVDVAVCNVDGASSSTELADILRELWSLGLKVICLDLKDSVEIFEYCNLNMINHVLMIKKANLRVHTKEKAIFLERKITIQELGEYFQKYTENASISVSLNRSDSKISNNLQESFNLSNSNNPVDCNINFVTQDKEKISGSQKKSFKNMMSTHMTSHLQRFSHKVSVEVFAVNLESPILRMIANFLEIDVADEQEFERSILPIVEKYSRHKKYIKQICDKMREVRSDKSRPVLILHSLNDMKFVTIM